jgi:hypothetical protein
MAMLLADTVALLPLKTSIDYAQAEILHANKRVK